MIELSRAQGSSAAENPPFIGIIMLDTAFPRILGDVGNPETFCFPVCYARVKGALPGQVVCRAEDNFLQQFIQAAQSLEAQGARALATSCGFLAIYHQALVNSVSIPVFTSSLLQIHLAREILAWGREVGVLTAHRECLTSEHFAGVGISPAPKAIAGLESSPEFAAVFLGNKTSLDRIKVEQEMIEAAQGLLQHCPAIGALVMECTNMSPYARIVQDICGVPVFDSVSMINYAYQLVCR